MSPSNPFGPVGSKASKASRSTPSNSFAISFEGKLYRESPSLAELGGKAAVAGLYLDGKVDLWVVGCTAEIGEKTVEDFTELLEEKGITAVALDWGERPLPPLAVAVAAVRGRTLAWFSRHAPEKAENLGSALDVIAADPFFPAQMEALRTQLQASEVGLDALRRKAGAWLQARFRDPRLSQGSFGQRITVAADDAPALPRSHLVDQLSALMTPTPEDLAVVAVLGGEGAGKTWLVSQWWSSRPDPPVMVLVPSRAAAALNPDDSTGGLARLLASQEGRSDEPRAVESWKRRLARWKTQGVDQELRFVVVLDGLNERASAPWAELIRAFAQETRALGGLLVVTARSTYWQRDVAPRLGPSIGVRQLEVPEYSDVELASLLVRVKRAVSDLPARVRDFVRNPRVCAVALKLLPRLLTADELTVERLLLEYWRERLEERSGGISHNVEDFHKLLRAHAKAWLRAPKVAFDRDQWVDRSGAAKRLGPQAVADDLTEIEEGRFLTPANDAVGGYVFRDEALPFALGLLINDELRQGLRDGIAADEMLSRSLSPVQGFDRLADVLAAAAGLACLDDGFPREGRRALITYWLGLHNVDEGAYSALAAYVPARPDAFLDVAELVREDIGQDARQQSLTSLITYTRDHPTVWAALQRRLPAWLGRWSRQSALNWRDGEDAERQASRERWIEEALAGLSPPEAALVRRLTTEIGTTSSMNLPWTAALLLAGRPQGAVAEGLVGWALAKAIAGDVHDAREELQWAVRLNKVDWEAVRDGVWATLASVNDASSERMKEGAARAFRLLGDEASVERADALSPPEVRQSWRRVETFCDTDPYDPDAAPPGNLDNARGAVSRIRADQLWLYMSPTSEDHDLDHASPGLLRFDPEALISKLRELLADAPRRTGLPLRQLSWRLPELAPLFGVSERAGVLDAYRQLAAAPFRVSDSDAFWVAGHLAESLMPGASPDEQLDIILQLPAGTPLYLNIRRGLIPLPPDTLERRLGDAMDGSDAEAVTRVLFFASGSKASLTERTRARLLDLLFGPNDIQKSLAAEIAAEAEDTALYDAVLDRLQGMNAEPDKTEDAFAFGRLVATAVVARVRGDLLDRVPPRFLGWAAAHLGGDALRRLAVQTEAVLTRLLQPIGAEPPPGVSLFYGASWDELDATAWFEEAEPDNRDLMAKFEELSEPERGARRFADRQRAVLAEVEAYRRALTQEGAAALGAVPPITGLKRLAQEDPARAEGWLRGLLAMNNTRALGNVRNLALVLAGAAARSQGDLAAAVFRRVWDLRSPTNVTLGREKTPLALGALFATRAPSLEHLWCTALDAPLDDASLQTAVLAAETGDANAWLDGYVDERLARPEPGLRARALTVAGFRSLNDHSDDVLRRSYGSGFLGAVASEAAARYARSHWTLRWLAEAATATEPAELWRYAQLAIGPADSRALVDLEWARRFCPRMKAYLPEVLEQLEKAVENKRKKRSATLFGLKAPQREVALLISDEPDETD